MFACSVLKQHTLPTIGHPPIEPLVRHYLKALEVNLVLKALF
jgi:hypothetical protein